MFFFLEILKWALPTIVPQKIWSSNPTVNAAHDPTLENRACARAFLQQTKKLQITKFEIMEWYRIHHNFGLLEAWQCSFKTKKNMPNQQNTKETDLQFFVVGSSKCCEFYPNQNRCFKMIFSLNIADNPFWVEETLFEEIKSIGKIIIVLLLFRHRTKPLDPKII